MPRRLASTWQSLPALVVIIAAMGYKFIVAGSVEKADDGRLAVTLEPAERALMLREMREFVVALQAVADGLARDDMKAVAQGQPRDGNRTRPRRAGCDDGQAAA